MARAEAQTLFPNAHVLREAHEGDRLHAWRLAELLDWQTDDLAAYLGVHKSTISHNPVSGKHQEKLARLAAMFLHAYNLMNGDLGLVRTWLRAPVPVLDRATPRDLVVSGRIDRVESLLDEVESGFSA
jgi:uncharacterized protein (DUF2384 family)